jgi:hypothetical protein
MYKICFLALCTFTGCAMAQDAPQPAPLKFDVGGVSVTLPGPNDGFIEVGDQIRPLFTKYLVPSENHIVSGYVEKSFIAKMGDDGSNAAPTTYAMIQVSRMADATLFDAAEFHNVLRNIPQPFGPLLTSTPAVRRADFQRRVREFDSTPIPPGRIRALGAFFSKPNAAGFGLVRQLAVEGKSMRQAQGNLYLCVHGKLLYGFIYTEYKGAETIDWLPKVLEQWADAILAANQ